MRYTSVYTNPNLRLTVVLKILKNASSREYTQEKEILRYQGNNFHA